MGGGLARGRCPVPIGRRPAASAAPANGYESAPETGVVGVPDRPGAEDLGARQLRTPQPLRPDMASLFSRLASGCGLAVAHGRAVPRPASTPHSRWRNPSRSRSGNPKSALPPDAAKLLAAPLDPRIVGTRQPMAAEAIGRPNGTRADTLTVSPSRERPRPRLRASGDSAYSGPGERGGGIALQSRRLGVGSSVGRAAAF